MTTIRSVTVQPNDGSSPTITAVTPDDATAAQVGDTLLIIHCNDFYAFANMATPTVLPGSPAVLPVPDGAADAGDAGAHIRSYTATVATAGAQTVSVTETGDANEEKALTVYVLAGADAANPVDDAAGVFGTSATPQPAPAVVPSTADALLICHVNSGGGASTASYTTPAPMVEQYEIHVGGLSGVGASEQLAAAGDTGTRTFTAASSVAWAAVSIAIRSAAGGGGTVANAVEGAATAAGQTASTRLAATAQTATATAAAQNGTASTSQNTTANAQASTAAAAAGSPAAVVAPGAPTAAAVAEALFDPGTSVSLDLIADEPIELTATALDGSPAVAPAPAAALAAAAANTATTAVSAAAEPAAAAAAGQDATATTLGGTTALAQAAIAAGAGVDAGVAVLAAAGPGSAAAAGLDAAVAAGVSAAAGVAAAAGAAPDPSAAVAVLAGAAGAAGSAVDGSVPGGEPQVTPGVMGGRVRRGAQAARRERQGARMGAAA
ncbi:hypothetical protein [Nonomuraea sp. NPDC023979]|uniref:hypothetical protein n=1 Tax=Nonomuraea sp. NPDC023979 TaxID=3154796 RepID=UPI0034073C0B